MQLILVRHALPERVDGSADPVLTELGQRQAARLVGALGGLRVDGLYVSPMARARGTAAPLAAALGRDADVVAGLAEYDQGSSRYVPVHEMAGAAPEEWARMLRGLLPEHVDVGAFRGRVAAALDSIVEAHPGRGRAVVVAHAGVINIWLGQLLGLERPLVFPLDYVGISRVTVSRDGRRVVRTVNETAHVADLLDVENAGARG